MNIYIIFIYIYICICMYIYIYIYIQTDFVPDNSCLVSVDVKSLYTNIPNVEGIKSVKTSLGKYSKRTVSTKVITTFLALILTLNNFIFNCKIYLQIKGCAMGTICAPSYANILRTTSKKNLYTHLSRHFHLHASGL